MIIQTSNEIARPIVQPPQHNYENFKTPERIQIEREKNITNDGVKKIVQQSINDVYSKFQKLVENSDYNVNYRLDEASGGRQFFITMKNTGNLVAQFPPDAAIDIAERSKHTAIGVIVDFSA